MGEYENIEEIVEEYKSLHFEDIINHRKINFYSLIHHSTAIEGSTLTELDAALLLDDDIVTIKSSFHDHLMVKDHYSALLLTVDRALMKQPVTVGLIKEIAAQVMKSTGQQINTYGGNFFDISKGDLRTVSVRSGNGLSYLKPEKVASYLNALCDTINKQLVTDLRVKDQLKTAFETHHQFEDIHPFGDGNGRTGRLLMNYIQFYHDLPPSIIRKELKKEYIEALRASSNEENDRTPIINFLFKEYSDQLQAEISTFKKENGIKTALSEEDEDPESEQKKGRGVKR